MRHDAARIGLLASGADASPRPLRPRSSSATAPAIFFMPPPRRSVSPRARRPMAGPALRRAIARPRAGKTHRASYLVYARSSLAYSGPPRAWGGNFPSCVKEGDFTLHQARDRALLHRRRRSSRCPSRRSTLTASADWTMNFDEQPAIPSLDAAQLAGRQAAAQGQWLSDRRDRRQARQGDRGRAERFPQENAFRRRMPEMRNCSRRWKARPQERPGACRATPSAMTGKSDVVAWDRSEMANVAISRGWWTVAAGACARRSPRRWRSVCVAIWWPSQTGGPRWCRSRSSSASSPTAFEIEGNADSAPERGFHPGRLCRHAHQGAWPATSSISAPAGIVQPQIPESQAAMSK